MHRLTNFMQGHQRVFLELKQPDIRTAFIQALKEASQKQAGVTAAASSSYSHGDNRDASDVVQGIQRQIHSGRKYPTSFGHTSFGEAYEPWSDDMACILQGSCLPGSTRYCRTLSMFTNMDLKDIIQGTVGNGMVGGDSRGKRQYHTLSTPALLTLLNTNAKTGFPDSVVSMSYATDSSTTTGEKSETEGSEASKESLSSEGQVSQRQRLKLAVRDYGSTVIVFHVCISLMSLGGFYLAVSSGVDVQGLLSFLGFTKEIIESKFATGTSTFVMAYAVHKVFAPARIAITLTCTPFIVRYLRGIGMLKARAVPK